MSWGGGGELGWLPGGLGGCKGETPTNTRDPLPELGVASPAPPVPPLPRPQDRSKGVNRKLGTALPAPEHRAPPPPRPGGPRAGTARAGGGVPRFPPARRLAANDICRADPKSD